ncbi:hypothetical protein [Dactylosporangium cerinum]
MFGQEPGILPQPLVEQWTARSPVRAELIPDCNHYTILTDPKPAARISEVLTRP